MATASRTIEAPFESSVPSDVSPRRATGLRRLAAAFESRPDLLNGTLALVNQAVISATTFVTIVIIGRYSGADSQTKLGIFSLALTIVYLARGIQEQVVSAPYVVYCHGRRDAAQARYAGSVLLHHLGLTSIALVIVLGMLGLLTLGIGQPNIAPALWVLLGALPFLQLREFVRRLAIAHLQLWTAIAIDLGVAVFQIGCLLTLAYFERLSVPLAYTVMGGACAIACCGWFFAKTRPIEFAWSEVVGDWWHNWGFARWALASHLIGFGTPYLMPWIVTAMSGSAEAGVLAASINLVGPASMFVSGLAAFLIPRASIAFNRKGSDELLRVLRVATIVLAVVLGLFAVVVLASGDSLLVLAYGDKYAGNGLAVGVFALGMLALGLGLPAGVGLWAIDRPKANLPADICTLVVTLVVMFVLLEPLGVLGAALGDVSGKVTGAVIRYVTFRRLLKTASPAVEV